MIFSGADSHTHNLNLVHSRAPCIDSLLVFYRPSVARLEVFIYECLCFCARIYMHIHRTQRFNTRFALSCNPPIMTKEEITILSLRHSSNSMSVTIICPFIYILTFSIGKKLHTLNIDNLVMY